MWTAICLSLPLFADAQEAKPLPKECEWPSDVVCTEEGVNLDELHDGLRKMVEQQIAGINSKSCSKSDWDRSAQLVVFDMIAAKSVDFAERSKRIMDSAGEYNPKSLSYHRYKNGLELAQRASTSGVAVRLDLADLALSRRCYEIADEFYRDVIKKYTSGFFSSYRERALVGIQDVRSRK